ncbi:MAG: carbohydrate binding family 9 domain-containing protein [Ignavibacteriae bacterium]|nr:carbohydrate binding family 9 domain-containing protein [Ignavibacteriota bacterium]
MRIVSLYFLLLSALSLVFADESKMLSLKKTTERISIDGVIEPAWATADSISDFIQQQPFHGQPGTKRTVAKVLTTDEALYCMIYCEDDVTNIQQNTGKQDDFGGDVVSIMFDTFGDKRTAYKFAVSASGIRADCRLLDDARNRDYSWDGVWFADAKVNGNGYIIEMEIPYRTIQYDEKLTEWGLDFDRWIPSSKEDLYWCNYEENEGQRISKFGKLKFEDFTPSVHGLNLEVYPVGIAKATHLRGTDYKVEPDAGIDIFYNPSQSLTFQLTGNPDFAQIEADPFSFNISRYESYFSERRPFFTQGNEVFMPSGRERNSGFYRPLELFYSRRIGKKLPDGSEVPLQVGTKAFGRFEDWEYGGFLAKTGEQDYMLDTFSLTEPQAIFTSARIKKQVLDNSSVGMLFVGKHTSTDDYGVLDIDGAIRSSEWQLAYQFARSFKGSDGDFAASAGFTWFKDDWMTLVRGRHIGKNFDISQVGFVPWIGTSNLVGITGPRWYSDEGEIRTILLYGGFALYDERVDNFMDYAGVLGYNMQFRSNWGFEINLDAGKSKDYNIEYDSYSASFSSWYNISPTWNASLYGGYQKTYNFNRNYLASYSWGGVWFEWKPVNVLEIGTSLDMFREGNPDGELEDLTLNSRPFISFTPVNDLNLRFYLDNVYVNSTEHVEQFIGGLLFSYQFLPKSWIYFALNEVADRSSERDVLGNILPQRMHITDRVGVLKVKYLYYL